MKQVSVSPARIGALLQGVVNAVVLCIIALAVFGQGLLVMGVADSAAWGGRISSVFNAVGAAIVPGLVLAFIKFVLNVIRGFRDKLARVKAVVYLLIARSPFTLGVLAAHLATTRTPQQPGRAEERAESEQFLRGQEWARNTQPIHDSDCTGSSEFARGCRHAIAQRRDKQEQDGRAWAAAHRPGRPSECQGAPYFVLGCRRYFYAQLATPKPAGQHKYEGMTTAECRTEVNANYEASEQLDLEHGNLRSIRITRQRSWLPDLADCENYDRHARRATNVAPQESPYERLTRLVAILKAEERPTEQDEAAVQADVNEVSAGSESGYRRAYFLLHEEYVQRLKGEYNEGSGPDARLGCADFQAKISEMQRLENERAAEIQSLKRAGGVIVNGPRHDELQRLRLDMLWDWKRYTDGAQAAGCKINMD